MIYYDLIKVDILHFCFLQAVPFMDFYSYHFLDNRYAHDEETAEDQEETGWKYIHGDVFRFPKYKSVLAAALGSGTQLFTL